MRKMGREGHLSDKFIRDHMEATGLDLPMCPGLGDIDEEVDNLTAGQRRAMMLTNKEFLASWVTAAEEKERVAKAKVVAAAIKKAESAAKKERLAEEKSNWATSKEFERVERAQK